MEPFVNDELDIDRSPVMQNPYGRRRKSLNGRWNFIIDPYDTGFRQHRNWEPFDEYESPPNCAFFKDFPEKTPQERTEYDFDTAATLKVPGDWNHQDPRLEYFEGTVWYRKRFDYRLKEGRRLFARFEAANYRADVYLNGQKLGSHLGGFDPFEFEITDLVQPENNSLVARVENRREKDRVPNFTTDWWNYGGITRDVHLIETPTNFVYDYYIQLDPDNSDQISGYVQLDSPLAGAQVEVSLPEIDLKHTGITDTQGRCRIALPANDITRWSTDSPKLYEVAITCDSDSIIDRIGFRSIATSDAEVLLNGESLFLRGIAIHEEIGPERRRAHSRDDAQGLLEMAENVNTNFVRLAHYPHNENLPQLADERGILVWEEIPVYWGIDFENEVAFQQAQSQMRTLVHRDKNRASVIIWSLANETPNTSARFEFLCKLKESVLTIDQSRLISAALECDATQNGDRIQISDPFCKEVDIISCNQYLGWYNGQPEDCAKLEWDLPSDKPFFVSEFGAGALAGKRGHVSEVWTEDYQAEVYRQQIAMLNRIPSWRGMSPWILIDFRSPRRNLPIIQDTWNRKGILSQDGKPKLAYHVLQSFYDRLEQETKMASSPESNYKSL